MDDDAFGSEAAFTLMLSQVMILQGNEALCWPVLSVVE
jgi:hypothetical protein